MSSKLFHINPNRMQPWNTLPDLPIHPDLYRTMNVYERLGEAKAALARLHGRSVIIPNQGVLINTISLQEAKASNAIENIFTTDDELYRAFSADHEEIAGAPKEVLRYREALWEGQMYLNEHSAFTVNYFIRMFQEIKQTHDEIRPDFINTVIKKGGTAPNAGSIIYTPPRGRKLIEHKLQNLCDFLNDDDQFNLDPLLKMAIGHYQFETIHPFRDGNGRTGRIANIHYLTNKGLLDYPILYLSQYILENKDDYYSGLTAVTQRGDWEQWLLFMLRGVETTSNITFNKINDIISLKEDMLHHIQKEARQLKQPEKLLEAIFTQPFTKVKHLVNKGVYSENTARDYLNKLAELQIVEKRSIGGHHYYMNTELHRILAE